MSEYTIYIFGAYGLSIAALIVLWLFVRHMEKRGGGK